MTKLSGELQRVSVVLWLGSVADIYLIDEPGAYLDHEQLVIIAKSSGTWFYYGNIFRY